ncbi:MAG: DUF3419 family protein [Verrucomicrobiota bacterium]|jgi:S-adenosylmethionine-diacylglycerol 3-amino-3-carboxypropyl transferase|nr:DUF3419 family protein [Verrucomicrobiota bacterium]
MGGISRASAIARKANFDEIRYAQCWEDADVLLQGLDVQTGDHCLSIASAGDNSLALLAHGAGKVIALDLNATQLHCVALRREAYRKLQHGELLELIGSRHSERRMKLYEHCRAGLPKDAIGFWDANQNLVKEGIGGAGKFERYFKTFCERVVPWVHSRSKVTELFMPRSKDNRIDFYRNHWNTWRWRILFKVFFSRFFMGRLGRNPRFFDYVKGSVAKRIFSRTEHAFTELSPAVNPYLHWIFHGYHSESLPFSLREENFEAIRANLDNLELRQASVEEVVEESSDGFDCFNLSDIFEYMSEGEYHTLLAKLVSRGRPGARLAYWNMLVPRVRPESMAEQLKSRTELSKRLHLEDKTFFYSRFVLEEVVA